MGKLIENVNRGGESSKFAVLTEVKLSSSTRAVDAEAAIDTTSPRQASLGSERARLSTISNQDQLDESIPLEIQ